MKKICLLIFAFLPLLVYSKGKDKEFVKIIEKHDVPVAARNLSEKDAPSEFWNALLNDNPLNLNLVKDISKGKGAEDEALQVITKMQAVNHRNSLTIRYDFRPYCDTLAIDMGLPRGICTIDVIEDESVNAFTVLAPNWKFSIYLCTGLLEQLDYNYYRIMSVVAHEFAHGALFHHLRTEYAVAKKKRKNKTMAAIAAGLNAVAAGADAYASSLTNSTPNTDFYLDQINQLPNQMAKSAYKFRYMFDREEELEADLVAFRFMDQYGLCNRYFEVLDVLKQNESYWGYPEDSNHPSTSYRIEFLKFVAENPEHHLKVTAKGKL